MLKHTRPLLACLLLLVIVAPAQGLVNGEEPAKDDRRFDAVAAFSYTDFLVANPETKPGKKDPQHNWYGCATLVAPDAVLFARHLINTKKVAKPGKYSVRFRRHANGTLGTRAGGPESYHQARIVQIITAPHADMAIGILDKPVTHIQPIPVNVQDTPMDNGPIVLAGWGSENKQRGVNKPRTGLRKGSTTATRAAGHPAFRFAPAKLEPQEVGVDKKTGKPKKGIVVVDDTVTPNMHDSGGAILQEDADGKLSIVGVITTYGSGSWVGLFADDERFPLPRLATEGAAAFKDLPFKPEPPKQ